MTSMARRDPSQRGTPVTGSRSLVLSCRPPLQAGPLLGFLGARAIPGVEEVRDHTYRRTLATTSAPAVIALTPRPDGEGVDLDVSAGDGETSAFAERAARRLFDLDADPAAITRTLGRDPILRPLVRAHRGIRVPGAAEGFEVV